MSLCKLLLTVSVFILLESCEKSSEVLKFGNRQIFMALTPGQGDLDLNAALDLVIANGFNGPGDVNIEWSKFEESKGIYTDSDDLLEWSRNKLSSFPINLTITPIQTTTLVLPEYLHGNKWNDSLMIDAFEDFVEYIAGELQGLEIATIAIGNEIDVFFVNDESGFLEYKSFFNLAKTIVKEQWPDAEVGVKFSYSSLSNPIVDEIISNSDVGIITYYPAFNADNEIQRLVFDDFNFLIDHIREKQIHLVEVGFPSSKTIGSSERRQRDFVKSIFEAWDLHKENIPSLTFVWLNDISEEVLSALEEIYQSEDPEFIEFLGSLGYRNHDKSEKLAYQCLIEEISLRK